MRNEAGLNFEGRQKNGRKTSDYITKLYRKNRIIMRASAGGINFTEHLDLKTKYDFFLYRATCRKMEFQVNGVKYRLHGIGCTAYNDDFFIDWDFGYRSRWYGIDPWKVALTLKMSKDINTEFYDGDLVKSRCDLLVEKDILFQHKNQYYFKIQKQEVFVPQFPENYDTLIIEWSGQRWEIPRKRKLINSLEKVFGSMTKLMRIKTSAC